MRYGRLLVELSLALGLLVSANSPVASAQDFDIGACESEDDGLATLDCGSGSGTPVPGATGQPSGQARVPRAGTVLVVFYRNGCSRCEEAREFLGELEAREPQLAVEWVEVRRDPAGRARFLATMDELGLPAAGVPVFVLGERGLVGFRRGVSEDALLRLIAPASTHADTSASQGASVDAVDLPLLGRLDWRTMPLPVFTVLIGLADGLNPCAFWVLMVMLGILLHVRSRARMALFGAVFVLMSGVVYFLFMSAWTGLFSALGGARWLSVMLGAVLALMGLINLKELVWFGRGVSLVIPGSAKRGLVRRMHGIAASASLATALVGIAALAFVVNLVELGCTIGLPAVYARILLLRELSWTARYAYLALYNLAYMIPLGLVVAACVVTLRRFSLSQRSAQLLKGISGVLLLVFGLLFLLWPDALG